MKIKKGNNLFILSIFVLIFTNYFSSFAQTEVSGNIIKNTTWTKDNSPYIVTGNILIYPNKTLIIKPGVVVKLDSDVSIQINGELIARGTETDSIFFIQNREGVGWGNIKFDNESIDASYDNNSNYISGSIIEYSRIEGAMNSGIYLDSSSPFIYKNTISYNSWYGVVYVATWVLHLLFIKIQFHIIQRVAVV